MKLYRLTKELFIQPYGSWRNLVLIHVSLIVTLSFFSQISLDAFSWISFFHTATLALANDIVFSIGHLYIFYNLDKNYDWLKDTLRRFSYAVLYHMSFTVIAFTLVQIFLFWIMFDMKASLAIVWIIDYWMIPIGVTVFSILLSSIINFFQNWKTSLVEEEKMRAEMMSYKFDALKGQINPTFLFDSFAKLKELIVNDQQQSVESIQKISRLYRSLLETKDMELVPLTDELKLVKLYADILKLQYGDQLTTAVTLLPEANERVVPVAIQNSIELLLKNVSKQHGLSLKISRVESYVFVELATQQIVAGISDDSDLKNLNRRYDFFTERKIEFQAEEKSVSLLIPILQEV